jgi:peptidase MA superfamily protein
MLLLCATPATAQERPPVRLDRGRFTAVAFPDDSLLARTLLESAVRGDTFPGLPRPTSHVLLVIAPDARRFREWLGSNAPEWGSAFAFPQSNRILMQGRRAGSDAGDPQQVFRHELAHLALHEFLGDLPPRWFDEGYASYSANEWGRDDVLATNVALALRRIPALDSLDAGFAAGASRANAAYALSYRAVAELAALGGDRGLALFFDYWKRTGSMDQAVRGAFGWTLARFEQEWQRRTRQRYGGLALAADLSVIGAATLLALLPLYLIRRQRDRRRMDVLVAADAVAEREARILDALLGESPAPVGRSEDREPPPGSRGRD